MKKELTIDFLVFRYKAIRSNGILADTAAKAAVVPLASMVFHLLGTCFVGLAVFFIVKLLALVFVYWKSFCSE